MVLPLRVTVFSSVEFSPIKTPHQKQGEKRAPRAEAGASCRGKLCGKMLRAGFLLVAGSALSLAAGFSLPGMFRSPFSPRPVSSSPGGAVEESREFFSSPPLYMRSLIHFFL